MDLISCFYYFFIVLNSVCRCNSQLPAMVNDNISSPLGLPIFTASRNNDVLLAVMEEITAALIGGARLGGPMRWGKTWGPYEVGQDLGAL